MLDDIEIRYMLKTNLINSNMKIKIDQKTDDNNIK